MNIEFNEEFRWQQEWITFPASVDGVDVIIRVTRNALDDRFHADANRESEESAYNRNRDTIREIARHMLAAGEREDDGSVVITSEAVIRYDPTLARAF